MRHRPWLQAEHSLSRRTLRETAGLGRQGPAERHLREKMEGEPSGGLRTSTLAEPSEGGDAHQPGVSVGAGPLSHSLLYQEQFLEDEGAQ